MAPHQWTLVDTTPGSGRTFVRPLGLTEKSFYYDRIFNGTADIVWRYTVELANGAALEDAEMFGEENVQRTWATLKQYYPLLGCRMEAPDLDNVSFVVAERALSHHQPDEVVVSSVSSPEERNALVWRLLREKPTEDHHLIARVFVLARIDKPRTYEVIFKAAHSIADGISGTTLARTFFDVLCLPPVRVPPLEERLAMALPSDALNPTLNMSVARQRWRRAIGKVTFLNTRKKLSGGHTVLRKVTDSTYRTPAVSQWCLVRMELSESRAILDSCRRHKVTLGAAIPVISQMAVTRMLHRRYLRGEISEEDWENRRRQPMHYGGPLNLRPYLDKEWQRKGGLTEIALMIDFYDCTLPFMPAPFGTRRDAGVPTVDGAPPFSALLSRERFLHRTRQIRKQIASKLTHPLLLDIAHARGPLYVLRKKMLVTHWQAATKGEPLPEYPELEQLDAVGSDFVFTGGMSSVGDLSPILPPNYPLPPGHPLSIRNDRSQSANVAAVGEASAAQSRSPPKAPATSQEDAILRMVDNETFLHCRPMEFFLGNGTTRGHLDFFLNYDANVYTREDAEEYLQECRGAALYYFGDQEAPARGKL